MNRRRRIVVISVTLCVSSVAGMGTLFGAQTPSATTAHHHPLSSTYRQTSQLIAQEDYSYLEHLVDNFYHQLNVLFENNNVGLESYLITTRAELASQFENGDLTEYEHHFLAALINIQLYDIYRNSNKKRARPYFDDALYHSQTLVDLGGHFASAYSLHSSILSAIFEVHGIFKWLERYRDSRDSNTFAFEIDATNPLAWQNKGLLALFIPPLFGGSVPAAITAFEHMVQHSNAYLKLRGNMWLSIAYFKNGDTPRAIEIIQLLRTQYNNDILTYYEESYAQGKNPFR